MVRIRTSDLVVEGGQTVVVAWSSMGRPAGRVDHGTTDGDNSISGGPTDGTGAWSICCHLWSAVCFQVMLTPWARASPARPSAQPWPTARTFQTGRVSWVWR